MVHYITKNNIAKTNNLRSKILTNKKKINENMSLKN